ncbi:MAG: regulatory protein RecX [Thermoleophilia bacterium]|nr:regulatory protein RecX [Thermoleophilia bacterium]
MSDEPQTGAEAHEAALRLLDASDHTAATLRMALARRGVEPAAAERVVAALVRTGLVDDSRFAGARAAALAERGKGDHAIAADLEARGLDRAVIAAALTELPPERERAERLVSERGRSAATARLLVSRGFSHDSAESAIAHSADAWLR